MALALAHKKALKRVWDGGRRIKAHFSIQDHEVLIAGRVGPKKCAVNMEMGLGKSRVAC